MSALEQRLVDAEELLAFLNTGFYRCMLNDMDKHVNNPIGDRILDYWKKWGGKNETNV